MWEDQTAQQKACNQEHTAKYMIFDVDEIYESNLKRAVGQDFTDSAFQKNIEFIIKKWNYKIDSLFVDQTRPSRLWNSRELTWGELYASSDVCE